MLQETQIHLQKSIEDKENLKVTSFLSLLIFFQSSAENDIKELESNAQDLDTQLSAKTTEEEKLEQELKVISKFYDTNNVLNR